jgi:hypothetical protein
MILQQPNPYLATRPVNTRNMRNTGMTTFALAVAVVRFIRGRLLQYNPSFLSTAF